MAIISNKETTTKTALANTTEFSIQADSALYSVLTKNIYTDTILAPIRELSTNAIDACLEANLPVNFDVHLPTVEEPTFAVRDYGSGLSQKDLLGLFCTVGASTKRDSNLYNGQFGLGRLSPLAYTNAFTVESFYNGNYYSHLISIQNGIPVSSELANSTTSEPNGLRLSLVVNLDDIRYFTEKAQDLYKYFDTKPKLNIELDINLPASEFISDDWSLIDRANSLVMSNIVYHIPRDSKLDNKGFSHILLHCPTGSVSINPGRESLSLDQPTIDYLNKRFEIAATEFTEIANDVITTQSAPINTFKMYVKMSLASPSSDIRSLLVLPTTPIFDKHLTISGSQYGNSKYIKPINTTTIEFKLRDTYALANRKLENAYYGLRELCNSKFIIIDTKTRFNDAIKKIQDSLESNLFILQRPVGIKLEDFIIEAKAFCNDFGKPYYLTSNYTSEHVSTTTTRNTADIYACNYFHNSFHAGTITFSNKEYIYVELTGYDHDLENFSYWRQFYDYLCDNYNYNKQLVGIQKKYLKAAEKAINFTPLMDELPQKLTTMHFIVQKDDIKSTLYWKEPPLAPSSVKTFYRESKQLTVPDTAISEAFLVVLKQLNSGLHYTTLQLSYTVNDLYEKYKLLNNIYPYNGQDAFNYYMQLEYINEQYNTNISSK